MLYQDDILHHLAENLISNVSDVPILDLKNTKEHLKTLSNPVEISIFKKILANPVLLPRVPLTIIEEGLSSGKITLTDEEIEFLNNLEPIY